MFETIVACGLLIIVSCLFFVVLIDLIIDIIKNKRLHKNHQEMFDIIELIGDKVNEEVQFYNTYIAPNKKEIKRILGNYDFLPKEKAKEADEVLEKLRRAVYEHTEEYNKMCEETEKLRERLAKYKREHNIKD